jgi:hypothetical protein
VKAPLGERHAGHGLAGDVDHAIGAHPHAGLDDVERRHQVVAEDLVRRVARRLRHRSAVDDDIVPANH